MWSTLRGWKMQELRDETWLDGLKADGLIIEAWGDSPWGQSLATRFRRHYVVAEEGKDEHGRPIHWPDKLLSMAARITDAARLAIAEDDFEVFILHTASTDLVMHRVFRKGKMVKRVLNHADGLVEDLVNHFDDGRTAFLFLSDHGCAPNGRHGTSDPEARRAYYLLYGKGIRPIGRHDIKQIDISSTILALFGRTPNAASAGRPLVETLALEREGMAGHLLDAARNRVRYLEIKQERGDKYTPNLREPRKLINELEKLQAKGEHTKVIERAGALLRRLDIEAQNHRRSNRTVEPLLWWIALGLTLVVLLLAMMSDDGRRLHGDFNLYAIWILCAALALTAAHDFGIIGPLLVIAPALFSAITLIKMVKKRGKSARFLLFALPALTVYLICVTLLHLWTGILCNTIIFNITKHAETVFVTGVQLLGVVGMVLLYIFRRPITASLEEAPFAWSSVVCVLMAGLNGYYQGFYFPFAFGVFLIILWKGVPESFPKPKLAAMLPLLACAWIFHWQITWNRHYYYIRYWMNEEHTLGGILGAAAFILLAIIVWWQFKPTQKRPGEEPEEGNAIPHKAPGGISSKTTPIYWGTAAYLACLVGARHILWPTPAEENMLSLGHHLQAALPAQLLFGALILPALLPSLLTSLYASRGSRGSVTPATKKFDSAVTFLSLAAFSGIAGSPFETPLVFLLTGLLVPLVLHPIYTGKRNVSVAAAAFTIVSFRVFYHVLFDFRFNFTTVHDLMKFSMEWGAGLWLETLPVLAMRHLPIMSLIGFMVLHRMNSKRIWQIGLLVLFFLGCRSLFIIVLAHLSREQLYLNWRNFGEILYYAFWAASWIIVIPVLGQRAVLSPSTSQGVVSPPTAPN